MAQRRARYAAILIRDGATKNIHVMAYDHAGAVATLERYADRNGYTIAGGSVERVQKRNAGAIVHRWEVDARALAAAKHELSLTWPVKIRRTTGQTQRGRYTIRGGVHTITVSHAIPVEQANRTLWHELAHAAQAERIGNATDWAAEVHRQARRHRYRSRPFEIDARAHEHHAERLPILKAA